MARRQLETAKQIVAVLGTMKGAAMKFGQVMSFLDVGLVAEEHREEFQRELAKLRDAAPTVSFKQMRRVIEEDLEEPISEIFSSFQEEPIAAASIGQVYRATLRDGREVAVKVQYPGVAGAVRADMQNLDMIMRLLKRMTPGLDVKAIAEEISERIEEELDYELEAQNQRSLARIFAGHPFIVVPEVVSSLSRERVLVSDYVEGVGFEELKTGPQAERDRLGEIVFRFFLGCLYRHHQFSGDPHPGNFLLLDDGRVAFLDFGLFKRMDASRRRARAGLPAGRRRGRRPEAARAARRVGLPARTGHGSTPRTCSPSSRDAIWWYTTADEVVQLTPRDRHPGDDRELRPALEPLPRDAPPGHAARAPLRPAHGDAHPGRAVPAASEGQLAPRSPASGCTARSRSPSSAARRPTSTAAPASGPPAEPARHRRSGIIRDMDLGQRSQDPQRRPQRLHLDGRRRDASPTGTSAPKRPSACPAEQAVGRASCGPDRPRALSRGPLRRGFRRFKDGGESDLLDRRTEQLALRADGSEFPVELIVSALRGGRRRAPSTPSSPTSPSARAREAERQRLLDELERALRGSEQRLPAIVDSLAEAITIRGRDDRLDLRQPRRPRPARHGHRRGAAPQPTRGR